MLLPGGMFGASRALGLLQRALQAVEVTIRHPDAVPPPLAISATLEIPQLRLRRAFSW